MAYRNPRYMVDHALRDRGDENVFVSGEDPETPKVRLADGMVARPFRFDSIATDHYVAVDLSATPASYARAIIPAGHTLASAAWVIEQSASAGFSSPTTLGSGTFAAGTALLDLTFTASTQRYLRLRISTSGLWTLHELYFTNSRTTTRGPDPNWVDTPVVNVNVTTMRSGEEYGHRIGEQRQEISYTYNRMASADWDVFADLLTATSDGAEPFYLDRTDDGLPPMMVRMVSPPARAQDRPNPRALGETYRVALLMRESLA